MESRDWLTLEAVSTPSPERIEARARLDPASPWFQGHFPGNPVFPGLGLLAFVERALRLGLGLDERGWAICKIRRVRFRRVLRPGSELRLLLMVSRGEGSIVADFELREGEDDVGRGTLRMETTRLTAGDCLG